MSLIRFFVLAIFFTAPLANAAIFRNPLNGQSTTQSFDALSLRGYHTGWDLTSSYDQNIYATADGKVVRMQTNDPCPQSSSCGSAGCNDHGMGNTVILEHTLTDGSKIYSLYAHMASFDAALSVGKCVTQGTVLGRVGGTGNGCINKYSPHLHFELKREALLENPTGGGMYWGYTPYSATGYGYYNPSSYVGTRDALNSCSSACGADRFANSYSGATGIRTNNPLEGECINAANDEDWFYFFGKVGQVVSLRVDPTAGSGLAPAQMAIKKTTGCSTGTCADEKGYTQSGNSAVISNHSLSSTGRFYVKIRGYGSTWGGYTFSKTLMNDGGNSDQPETLSLGTNRSEFINYPADEDWYAFTLNAGQTVSVSIYDRNAWTYSETSTLKLQSAIYNSTEGGSSAVATAADNENGAVTTSTLTFTAPSYGTYYLKVRGYGDQTGYYELHTTTY